MIELTLERNPVTIAGEAVTVAGVIKTNILVNTLVESKTDYYHKICKYFSK